MTAIFLSPGPINRQKLPQKRWGGLTTSRYLPRTSAATSELKWLLWLCWLGNREQSCTTNQPSSAVVLKAHRRYWPAQSPAATIVLPPSWWLKFNVWGRETGVHFSGKNSAACRAGFGWSMPLPNSPNTTCKNCPFISQLSFVYHGLEYLSNCLTIVKNKKRGGLTIKLTIFKKKKKSLACKTTAKLHQEQEVTADLKIHI